jgi:uncharacterized protein YgfB (UPF0149 family)
MLYEDINTIVAKADAELSAAESQGMAAGMLCINVRSEPEFWLREILQDDSTISLEDRSLLEGLFEETRNLLLNDEFDFELLLPDDEVPLAMQVEALRKWCQGFLYGLGTTASSSDWPQGIREIVKDIAECTKLEAETEGEEAENDFMEITEYLRAAVMFLSTSLGEGSSSTIH